jgi:hypothetical protein
MKQVGEITIAQAIKLIEDNWNNIGMCSSCGYHASLHEHGIQDYEIENALKDDGVLELLCQNEDGGSDHRMIKIYLNQLPNPVGEDVDGELRTQVSRMIIECRSQDGQIDEYGERELRDDILALIQAQVLAARRDELEKFTHSESSIHLLAEKICYKPEGLEPISSWPILETRGGVVVVVRDYLYDRLKSLSEGGGK